MFLGFWFLRLTVIFKIVVKKSDKDECVLIKCVLRFVLGCNKVGKSKFNPKGVDLCVSYARRKIFGST